MKLIRIAIPSGHSVPFWIVQTTLEGENFGSVSTEAGIMIMTTRRPIMFNVEPYELKRAIHKVGMLEMHA